MQKSYINNKKPRTSKKNPQILLPQTYDDKNVKKKILKHKQNQKRKYIRDNIRNFISSQFTINYKSQFNFNQQWQNLRAETNKEGQIIFQENYKIILLSILIILVNTLTIWYRNINFFFYTARKTQNINFIYQLSIFVQIIDAIIKIWIKLSKQELALEFKQIFFIIYKNIICILFLLVCLLEINSQISIEWTIFQILCLYFFYTRASHLYQSFRLKDFALIFQHQFKLFDLILNLLIIAHLFSIILYLSGTNGQQKSWLTAKDINYSTQYTLYLYSFYFSTTTILTVGYGDITPQNQVQICAVMFVQIIGNHNNTPGICMFGFIINQIGYTVSIWRKGRQILQRDLLTLEKMKKIYKLQNQLVQKSRNFIISQNDQMTNQLLPQQQNALMMKFNQDLRKKIYLENSLSVLKSSIFFLCRWTKNMQSSISSKLNHILLAPGQQLYQPVNKKRIYIIRHGKVDIYTDVTGNKGQCANSLKNINASYDNEVSDNCFGYSVALSNNVVKLKAVAKNSSFCYFIQSQAFINSCKETIVDIEYLHEIKTRLQTSSCPEAFECPSIKNGRQHFSPSIFTIIRKLKKQNNIQKRDIQYYRHKKLFDHKKSLIIVDKKFSQRLHTIFIESIVDLNDYDNNNNIEEEIKQSSHLRIDSRLLQIQSKITDKFKFSKNDSVKADTNKQQIKNNFSYYFQEHKEYQNYFTNYNSSYIIKKYYLCNFSDSLRRTLVHKKSIIQQINAKFN